jgi:adenylyl-sulfate kinase
VTGPSANTPNGLKPGGDEGLRTIAGAPTVWFTGLSGAGKTTIARALAIELRLLGLAHAILDGDEIRDTLSADLGFSREDRAEQVRRVGHIARILGDAGVIPLVALVSPFRADRDAVRTIHGPARFVEVHVATSLATCAQRDVKGLYAQARDGRVGRLTGVDQDYEPPERAEVTLDGHDAADVEELAGQVLRRLTTMLARTEAD